MRTSSSAWGPDMTQILTATVLPDPLCDINIEFIMVCACADGLHWFDRETLALEVNQAADQNFLLDLEEAGLY